MAEMNTNESMPFDGVKLLDDDVVAAFVEGVTRARERLEEVQTDFAVRFQAQRLLIREPEKLVDHIWSKADGVRRDLVELRDRQAQLEREQAQLAQQRADLERRTSELDMLKGIHQRMDRFESSLALRPVTQDLSMARRETAEGLKKLRSETAQELAKFRGETLQELTALRGEVSQLAAVRQSLDGLADRVSDSDSVRGIVAEGLHEALSPLRASLVSLDVAVHAAEKATESNIGACRDDLAAALDSLATGPLSEGFSSLDSSTGRVESLVAPVAPALSALAERLESIGREAQDPSSLEKLREGVVSGVRQALGTSIHALQADVDAAVGRIGDRAQALHKVSEQNAAEMGNRLYKKADALAAKLDDSSAALRSGQDALAEAVGTSQDVLLQATKQSTEASASHTTQEKLLEVAELQRAETSAMAASQEKLFAAIEESMAADSAIRVSHDSLVEAVEQWTFDHSISRASYNGLLEDFGRQLAEENTTRARHGELLQDLQARMVSVSSSLTSLQGHLSAVQSELSGEGSLRTTLAEPLKALADTLDAGLGDVNLTVAEVCKACLACSEDVRNNTLSSGTLEEQMSELTASLSSASVRQPAGPSTPSPWMADVSRLPEFLDALAPAPGSAVDHGDVVGILSQAYMYPNQRENLEAFLRDAPNGKRFCLLGIAQKGHTHPVVAEGRCFCFVDRNPEDRDCVTVSNVAGQACYVLTKAA